MIVVLESGVPRAVLVLPAGSLTAPAPMVAVILPAVLEMRLKVHVMLSAVLGALAEPVPAVKVMSAAMNVAGSIASENVMVMEYGVLVGLETPELKDTPGGVPSQVTVLSVLVEAMLSFPAAPCATAELIFAMAAPLLAG